MIREHVKTKVVSIMKEVECDLCKAYKNFEAKSRHGVNKMIADDGWIINGRKGDKSMRNLAKYGNILCSQCYTRIRTDNAIEGDEYRYTHWDDDMPNQNVLWNPTLARGKHRKGLIHRHSYNLITDMAVWVIEAWAEPKINDMLVDNAGLLYIRANYSKREWISYSDMMNNIDNPLSIYYGKDDLERQMGHRNDGVVRVWHLKEDA